jgi:hypothetical protein
MQDLLANGRIEGHEVEVLRQELYADGKIDRQEADFLVEMHKRVQRRSPGFEEFFYQAVKDHVLTDGNIRAEEANWLRQMLYQDDEVGDPERKFLQQLQGEAKQASPEFQELCKTCLQ